jgi:N12 class adenine-specific DNA methylase
VADGDIDVAPNMELMLHQSETIEKCLSQRSTLVACAIGTGKTAIGIGCLDPEKKSLVVVPASLKHNWVKEIGLWEPSWDVELADKDAPKSGVRVCSYNDLVDLWVIVTRLLWPMKPIM